MSFVFSLNFLSSYSSPTFNIGYETLNLLLNPHFSPLIIELLFIGKRIHSENVSNFKVYEV